MCHQSVGLIAREVEARGIATVCLSSAYSITAEVNPPRAVYIDYPLGHTAGKPNDSAGQRRIMLKTLQALEASQSPGTFVDLNEQWLADDSWKDRVMRPAPEDDAQSETWDGEDKRSHADDRVARHATPQYQTAADALAAPDPSQCASCLWLGNEQK